MSITLETSAIAQVQDISVAYQAGKPVLENISLEFCAGQLTGILGPSGSGKTTLLKVLLGLVHPHKGQVIVNRQHIGYVPQVETVDWNFPVTVEQVVLMGHIGLLPWTSRTVRQYGREIMAQLGIADLASRHIRTLSGGQQQRAFLARALVVRPALLILDEPTAGVDMRTQEDILHLLNKLALDGMAIVMTTHDLNAAASHLPRIICLNKTVIADGTPDQIFTSEILNATYHGDMIVFRQNGMIFAHERPHRHDSAPIPPIVVHNRPPTDPIEITNDD